MKDFRWKLSDLLKKYPRETENYYIPDYIVADYLVRCLENIDTTFDQYKKWKEDERMWNYYIDPGLFVKLDGNKIGRWTYPTLSPYLGKWGKVLECNSDMHAYARGTAYCLKIDFDGDIVDHVPTGLTYDEKPEDPDKIYKEDI